MYVINIVAKRNAPNTFTQRSERAAYRHIRNVELKGSRERGGGYFFFSFVRRLGETRKCIYIYMAGWGWFFIPFLPILLWLCRRPGADEGGGDMNPDRDVWV